MFGAADTREEARARAAPTRRCGCDGCAAGVGSGVERIAGCCTTPAAFARGTRATAGGDCVVMRQTGGCAERRRVLCHRVLCVMRLAVGARAIVCAGLRPRCVCAAAGTRGRSPCRWHAALLPRHACGCGLRAAGWATVVRRSRLAPLYCKRTWYEGGCRQSCRSSRLSCMCVAHLCAQICDYMLYGIRIVVIARARRV